MRNCLTHSCKNKHKLYKIQKKESSAAGSKLAVKNSRKTSHSGVSRNGQNPDGKSQSINLEKLPLKKSGEKVSTISKTA